MTAITTPSIKNDIFYQKLCTLAEATIELFREKIKTTQFSRPILTMRRTLNQVIYESKEIPSYELLITSDIRFYAMDELNECVEVIKNDTILNNHYEKLIKIGNQSSVFFSIQTLTSLCSKALEDNQKGLDFKINLLKSYENLKRFFCSNTLPVLVSIPISNMKLNRVIEINHEMHIKKASLTEKESFLNTHFLPMAIPNILRHLDTFLVFKYTVNKTFEAPDSQNAIVDHTDVPDRKVNCLSYALELLNEGCFDLLGTFKRIEFDIPEASLGINSLHLESRCFGSPYDTRRLRREKLKNTYHRILNLINHRTVQNALTWLDHYTKESTLHKRVIFITIVVETLFTKPGETDLLTHKISTRIARLIGRSLNERGNIYEDLKKFYNLRSKILHGEDVGDQNKNEKIVNGSVGYIRCAINSLMIKAKNFDRGQSFLDGHAKFLRELDLK